jgi:hypothetical protein
MSPDYRSIPQWVAGEMATLDLGDERLDRRGKQVLVDMCEEPMASINGMSEGWAEAKGAYRFLNNANVDPADIRAALVDGCLARVAEQQVVVAIQDTTSLDFSGRESLELGPTGGGNGFSGNGLFVHSTIAASADGVPLGLLAQIDWVRDPAEAGSRHKRRQVPIEEKESFRWIESQRTVRQLLPVTTQLIHVADREADIFEMFAEPRRENEFMLVRACRERRLVVAEDAEERAVEADVTQEDEQVHTHLLSAVANAPVVGEFDLTVRRGNQTRRPREVRIAVRLREVTLKPPTHGVHAPDLKPVTLNAVLAEEIDPPEKQTPVKWMLLTDLDVDDFETARECVRLYSVRWLIERYHYALKSGCRIEETQLHSLKALRTLLALYSAVALRLLWITYAARIDGEQPCTVAFSTLEWKVLFRNFNPQEPFPATPPPLHTAVRWMARLGGYKARKGDGPPGVKALWTGLTKLQHMAVGAAMFAPEDVGKD